MIRTVLLLLTSVFCIQASAQADSTKVIGSFNDLCKICAVKDTLMIEGQEEPRFFKAAAPYVLYVGDDSTRSWKSSATYLTMEEQEMVDMICYQINELIPDSMDYHITDYFEEQEPEGLWRVLEIERKRVNLPPEYFYFAFLMVEDRFVLGDISTE